jgi:hypothetical protein
MILTHHDLKIPLPDSWWAEAEMADFVPQARAFRPDRRAKGVFEVSLHEVAPVKRGPGVGIFNDKKVGLFNEKEATARERVLQILRDFRDDAEIWPICLKKLASGDMFRYEIGDGSHRFYCSLAAGFSHVPAFEGYDFSKPI